MWRKSYIALLQRILCDLTGFNGCGVVSRLIGGHTVRNLSCNFVASHVYEFWSKSMNISLLEKD